MTPDWTKEQLDAITITGRDLLVSASAGSGKTAVLVERVIRLALDPESPCGLDRFLVVTFTEAAAAEMREKIADALRKRLAAAPEDDRVRRQLLLLDHAQISTIHAFCNRVLRQHFHQAEVDPEFTILNEEEAALLRAETADALFQKEFDRTDPFSYRYFVEWMESFPGANPGVPARRQLLRLHAFLTSLDDPEGWRESVRTAYPLQEDGTGKELPFEEHFWSREWMASVLASLRRLTKELSAQLGRSAGVDPKLSPWIEAFLEMARHALELAEAGNWESAVKTLHEFKPGNMPRAGKDAHPDRPALKERLNELRDVLLRKELLRGFAAFLPSEAARAHAASAPLARMLVDLVERFEKDYQAAKKQRAALDFQDLEQGCLRLMRGGADGRPSEVALLCREQYDYVLVDEYQDVNHAQEAILALVARDEPDRPRNRFMVGDVKQSIYAFRQAAPDIFQEKYDTYTRLENCARINLNKNFRSRPEILEAVNGLFEALMTKDTANLNYDRDAALVPGKDYDALTPPPRVELHLLDTGASSEDEITLPESAEEKGGDSALDWQAAEREAYLAGRMILEMTSPSAPNPSAFKDIVVLLRSMQDWAEAFISVFRRMGIPAFTDYGTGLLAAPEVRDMLHFLNLLDNPLQDIPLAAVLRSPLEGWTETEMLALRQAAPQAPFHEAFRLAAESGAYPRAADFQARLEEWRGRARRQSLADLLSDLYEETHYPSLVLGMAGGELHRANLLKLQELAGRFDHFSRRGLARFLRFVDQLREQEGDYGAAAPFLEGSDVVRVMTVHKSKGLEFPVVFLCGLGKNFNLMDLREPLLFDRRGGLGALVEDSERSLRYPSPGHLTLAQGKKRDAYAEELRVLYVALTRAKERLILTGGCKKLDELFEKAKDAPALKALDASSVLAARTRLEWILPASLPGNVLDIKTYGSDEQARWSILPASGIAPAPEREAAGMPVPGTDSHTMTDCRAAADIDAAVTRLNWAYPHRVLAQSPARITMRDWKRRLTPETEAGESVAAFSGSARARIEKLESGTGKISAAERGSLTHFALRHLDLSRPLDYAGISAQLDGMIDQGFLTEEQRGALDLEALAAFWTSPLAQRVLRLPPDRIWREVPFLLGISPSEARMEELREYDDSERIRAQGVLDLLFQEEGGGLVLLDYKTDAVATPAQAAGRAPVYYPQMRIYRKAVEYVFGAPPKEMYLCFLNARENILVPASF